MLEVTHSDRDTMLEVHGDRDTQRYEYTMLEKMQITFLMI